MDVELRNPLDAEISLSGFTVAVKTSHDDEGSIQVETLEHVVLGPHETRPVSGILHVVI